MKDVAVKTYELENGIKVTVTTTLYRKTGKNSLAITTTISTEIPYGIANKYPTPGSMYSDIVNANVLHKAFLDTSAELDEMAGIDPTDPLVLGRLMEFALDLMIDDFFNS